MSGYRIIAMLVMLASMCGGGATCAAGAAAPNGTTVPGLVIMLAGFIAAGAIYNLNKKR
jgi:NaMN:DMB phosphoribosyltransferase